MSLENLVSPQVRRKLAGLRLFLRGHLLARGLACLALALVAAVFFTLAVDRLLRLDRAQRGLIAALALSGIAYVLWRFALRPLRVPMGQEDLALVLERHYPDLDDRLISTLQFSARQTARIGASQALIERLAEQTNRLAERLDVGAVVAGRGTWRRMGLAGLALAVLAAFTLFNRPLMSLWFQRNVLFADVDWPKDTYLTVHGGPVFKVVRGGKLEVTVSADPEHVVPAEVTFHLKFPGLGTVYESVGPAEAGGHVFVKAFENVSEPFEFFVTGHDDRTKPCRVFTVDPPELVEVSFVVIEPAYMNTSRQGRNVSDAHGMLSVPAGSTVLVTARANKDLSSVRLLLDRSPVGSVRILDAPDAQDPAGPPRPRGLRADVVIPERPGKPSLTMEFELTDTEEVTNPRGALYVLRIDPDRPPAVTLARAGVRGDVTAQALIPLTLVIQDDRGVAEASVSVAPTTRPAAEKSFPVEGVQAGRSEITASHSLDLRPLNLTVGELIRVIASARDTLPESFGGPNVGTSAVHSFKVVSEEELLAELVRREKEIRNDFTRVVALQAEVRDRVRALSDRLQRDPAVDAEARRVLTSAAGDQRRIASMCALAAEQYRAILEEMVCNRVGGAAEQKRLEERIINRLAEISKKPMTDVSAAMDEASKGTDGQRMQAFADASAGVLDGFYRQLDEILKEMRDLENRQELAGQLKKIIEWSEELRERILRQVEGQGGEILGPASRPAP